MRYVLAGLLALTMPLLAWLVVSLHASLESGALMSLAVAGWTLVPFVLLAALFRACSTTEERVMFFAGAVAVLMFCLGLLADLAISGEFQDLGMPFLHLPVYISVALLVCWALAQIVGHVYRRTSHHGGSIGWEFDAREDT
jgi:hypothetical protein